MKKRRKKEEIAISQPIISERDHACSRSTIKSIIIFHTLVHLDLGL